MSQGADGNLQAQARPEKAVACLSEIKSTLGHDLGALLLGNSADRLSP